MEYHGDEDYKAEPDMKRALEYVVEDILDHGGYPAKGRRRRFDLYEFLSENRDPSFFLEMYVAAMSDNRLAFGDRIERERATVEAMLVKHLTGSDMVAERAAEDAE
jgi:hypothetical protein